MTTTKSIKLFAAVVLSALSLTVAASAQQILTIDNERVEREAAAYKDFRLQTTELQETIRQRQQYLVEGGVLTQQLVDLEKRKTLIGNDKFEEERNKIRQRAQQFQQDLQILNTIFENVGKEAAIQIDRARQPLLRQLIKDRKALIIIPKRVAMANAAGLDITTEFIELLDASLAAVTLTKLPNLNAAANPATPPAAAPAGN
ncbi:MAG: hypothetical protein COB37_01180 [Kordiimonadales bacterium]|nr:MAG: hypothetical protein COB37_01180 [Kordiimonadales bacterium]